MSRGLLALALALCVPPIVCAQQMAVEFYQLDAQGNVLVLTDWNGAVVESHDYDVFGQEVAPLGANTQPKRFTGKERDTETGWDYFGARYYGSKIGRFTTVDPVYTWRENILDPQRWNKYAYARNNPLRYMDPDGREVTYANAQLQTFFTFLSARSATIRGTLGLYTGPGKPDLFIQQANAGRDIDGSPNLGVFSTSSKNYEVDYTGKEAQMRPDMTVEQIEDLGTWRLVGQSTLTLDSSLPINVREKKTIGVAAHELGHADQAARNPLGYKRDAAAERDAKGKVIEHDRRPAEVYANKYGDRAVKEVNP